MILNPSFSQNSVSRHYDELSILYRKIWGEHLHHGLWLKGDEDRFSACDKLTEFVFSYLGDLEGREVLDIGCGYGASARVAENKGANITGITLSREQWEYARQRSNGHYILGDWNDCELKNESFDCGYSIECFSHVRDKEKFFKQIFNKLRPGARFCLTAWLSCESPTALQERLILRPICEEGRLPSLYSSKEVKELIRSQGFELEAFSDISMQVGRTWSESIKLFASSLKEKELLSYLLNPNNSEKSFVLSLLRLYLGFKIGTMKYGVFVFKKN